MTKEIQYQTLVQYREITYYQYQDYHAWLGPAEVVYHKDKKVWFYTYGNLQKVVGCKVKIRKSVAKRPPKCFENFILTNTHEKQKLPSKHGRLATLLISGYFLLKKCKLKF